MFGVSFPELIVIFIVVLIVFGPEKLPELARTLGKLSAELRKGSDAVRREIYNTVYKPLEDADNSLGESHRELRAIKNEITQLTQSLKDPSNPLASPTNSPTDQAKQ